MLGCMMPFCCLMLECTGLATLTTPRRGQTSPARGLFSEGKGEAGIRFIPPPLLHCAALCLCSFVVDGGGVLWSRCEGWVSKVGWGMEVRGAGDTSEQKCVIDFISGQVSCEVAGHSYQVRCFQIFSRKSQTSHDSNVASSKLSLE